MLETSETNDQELLASVSRGDQAALGQLYDRYGAMALGVAFRVVQDRGVAEEVVQDAFVAAWLRAASYEPDRAEVRTWLLSIVHHRAIDRTRDAMKEAGTEAQTQVSDWRGSLDKASDEVRRELGILAVRAQRSPEALRAMSAEIRKRKTEIAPSK